MSFLCGMSKIKYAHLYAFAGLFAASLAGAQTSVSNESTAAQIFAPGGSSSLQSAANTATVDPAALPAVPAANGVGAKPEGQEGGAPDTNQRHGIKSLLGFE